jgi:hypothetical protein
MKIQFESVGKMPEVINRLRAFAFLNGLNAEVRVDFLGDGDFLL